MSATPHVPKHTAVTRFFELGGLPADGHAAFATSHETLMKIYLKRQPDVAQRGADVPGRATRGRPAD